MWAIFLKSMGFKDIKYDIPVCQIHYKLTKRPVVPLNAIFAFIGFWRLLQSTMSTLPTIMSTLRTLSALLTMHIVSFEIFWVKECKSVNYVKDCVPSFGIFYIKFVAVFRNPHAGPQLWTKHRSPSAFQSGIYAKLLKHCKKWCKIWLLSNWNLHHSEVLPLMLVIASA